MMLMAANYEDGYAVGADGIDTIEAVYDNALTMLTMRMLSSLWW